MNRSVHWSAIFVAVLIAPWHTFLPTASCQITRTTPYCVGSQDPADGFGEAMTGLGDANGDGFDDLAMGAPFAGTESGSSGRVEAINGFTGESLWAVAGTLPNARLGGSLIAIDDVDGDGVNDLLASSHWAGPVFGEFVLRLLSGQSGADIAQVTVPRQAAHPPSFSTLSDINGDGIREIAVSLLETVSPGYALQSRYMIFDTVSGIFLEDVFLMDIAFLQTPPHPSSISAGADLNLDGVPEVAVGVAYGASPTPPLGFAQGVVTVVDGATGAIQWTKQGITSQGGLGHAVLWIDVQGVDYVAAGAPGISILTSPAPPGSVFLLDAQNGSIVNQVSQPSGLADWGTHLSRPLFSDVPGSLTVGCVSQNQATSASVVVARQISFGIPSIAFDYVVNGVAPCTAGSGAAFTAGRPMLIGDVNGDARPDLAIARDNTVHIHRRPGGIAYGGGNPAVHQLSMGAPAITSTVAIISVAGGMPGGTAYVLVGLQPASVPLAGGVLLVDVSTAGTYAVLPMVFGSQGVASNAIFGELHYLNGFSLFFQALSPDASAPGGLVLSNGIQRTI